MYKTGSLFNNEDGYTLYSVKEVTRRPGPDWRHWLALVGSVLIFAFLIKLFLFNQPSTSYDRALDVHLPQYSYRSEAARALPSSGFLFCWVLTSPSYHTTRALAVNDTWLRRCDHGQFFTSDVFTDRGVPYTTLFAGIPDTYDNLFYKSRYAFHHIKSNMNVNFDWYLKADDDTFVIVENLKKYLHTLDPRQPYYVGFRLKPYLEHGYNGGGAGYVLSREALRLFDLYAYPNETACPDDRYEDVGIARCLASLNIFPHKTLTSLGQQRFNSHRPDEIINGFQAGPDWFLDPFMKGMEAIPSDLVSFHHLTPDEIRLFEVLLYRVRVHGEHNSH